MGSVLYMYLWEEINAKFQMYPFHSAGSSTTHKFLVRLDVHATFVCGCSLFVGFCAHLSIGSHGDSWINPLSLSVMTSGFISICKDSLHSYFNPWFKINSRPILAFLYPLLFRYAIFTFIASMFWMVSQDLVWGVWCLNSVHFCKIVQERAWFIILSLPLYLFFSHESTLF